ncbi:hypothetical protein QL285_065519 [Trifolium repens]|nr:hypothetical protein QL285_065519 [Trifolium repens]
MRCFWKLGNYQVMGNYTLKHKKKKDGSFVNDAAKTIVEQIEEGLAQSTNNESEVSPNDIVGRVLGPEHSGRVRCMGMGAAPTGVFRNTRLRISDLSHSPSNVAASSSSNPWQERCIQLESQVQTTVSALKAYVIMKEGKIPDNLAGFFDLPHVSDQYNIF